ncbi:MAG: hypothetical protein H7327_04335 [Herminiimonas sp.]|nr:hypothetical protein [Herminiimonas sp.]
MIENPTSIPSGDSDAGLVHARQDWTSARFVEEAISIQFVYGTRYAASFMKNRMIDIDVALRVLLNPAQRRNHAPA